MSDLIVGNDVTVSNLDELADLIADVLSNNIKVDIGNVSVNTDDLKELLTQINDKIPQPLDLAGLESVLNNLNVTIQGLSQQLGISGENKAYGKSLSIPATKGDFELDFIVEANGVLTDVVYSLSAWNYNDTWDLLVNDNKIFSNITTKEFGEDKCFIKYKDIKKNDIIKIVFHNNSGSNKILWSDINVVETPAYMQVPGTPINLSVSNSTDTSIVMMWS